MAVNGQVLAQSEAEALRARLEEPQTAAALNTLLDHVDLLAVMVTALDGFIGRSDAIVETLADAVTELRTTASNADLPAVDVKGLVNSAAAAAPTAKMALDQLSDPRTAEVVTQLSTAVNEAGRSRAAAPNGPLALLRALKDPDVSRALGFMLQVAKAFGRQRG